MILSPEVLSIVILDVILSIFSIVAFIISLNIFFKWDFNASSKKQYKLEKQSFLGATIIKYILFIKIILFIFFIFTLDRLSNIITGAMCAAGVVDATSYGIYLLLFKLLNIYLFGFWLVIHNYDMKNEKLPFTKHKFGFFIIIFILFICETILELSMFASIDVAKLVSCCGTLYSNSENSYISTLFKVNQNLFIISFYISFSFLALFYLIKNAYFYTITNFIFLILAIITLIIFFGTYIYEIPTHNCPFCMLQKEYNYIGYIIYTTLFLGTFFGFCVSLYDIYFKNRKHKFFKISFFINFIYVLLVSYFVLSYYIRFGVFL